MRRTKGRFNASNPLESKWASCLRIPEMVEPADHVHEKPRQGYVQTKRLQGVNLSHRCTKPMVLSFDWVMLYFFASFEKKTPLCGSLSDEKCKKV